MDKTRLHIIYRIIPYKHLLMGLFCVVAMLSTTQNAYSQCTLACNDQLQINLNSDGFFVVTPSLLFQGNISNCLNLGVELYDSNFNFIGDTITCDQVGTTVAARLYNYDTNAYCETDLYVIDSNAPVLSCPEIFVACNADVHPDAIGYPLVDDNCTSFTNSDLSYSDQIVDLACFTAHSGVQITARIDRTWLVSDESGNQAQCIQAIYLKRATLNDVIFPESLTGDDAITCGTDDPTDFNLTGVPLIEVGEIDPNGNCDISVLYNDQVFNSCGGSTTTFRKWVALDACTNTIREFDQIIELKDKFGPQFTCPSDITINANTFSCDATVRLPEVVGMDECSDFTIDANWEYGHGFDPVPNVPVGTHVITYTATDACNNTTSCSFNFTIVDNSPPTPICVNNINVTLLPSGVARVFASSFDEGSFDNCGIDRYEVRRDTNAFGGFIDFSCEDIFTGPVLVHLRAYDIHGLSNDCWVEVTVRDNSGPNIVCPTNKTIDCQSNISNLGLLGSPGVSDACGVDTVFYEDSFNLVCGIGTIQRRWNAIDIHGNSNFCIQTINVVDNEVLDITFPEDVTVDFCTGNIDEAFTGEPNIDGVGCKNILTNKSDQTFSSNAYCYTVFRTWTVINWCVYDPNSGTGEGEYTHVQRIDVIDTTAPIISCASDTTILNYNNNCASTFVTLSSPLTEDCSGFTNIRNESPYADSVEGDASGVYPNGIHVIEYIAFDDCGNASYCQQTVEVKDGLGPNLICKSGVSVEMTPFGSITVDPSLLIASVSDNCTPVNLISYILSPNTFSCDDVGLQTVSVTATDLEGNTSTCNTTIDVQDNMFACSPAEVNISGRMLSVSGQPIVGLAIDANGAYTTTTDANGFYSFDNLPAGVSYTVNATDIPVERDGITTFDMVLIVAHILQTRLIDDPYKIIAVDVDDDNGVSVFDLIGIRQLILHQVEQYTSNIGWQYVAASYNFVNPNDPLSENYPRQIYLPSLNQDINNADFVAIKMGDIDGDGVNLNDDKLTQRNKKIIHITVDDEPLKYGEVSEIDFKLGEQVTLYGFQFAIEVKTDLVEFISLTSDNELDINSENFVFDELSNSIICSWNTKGEAKFISQDEILFSLKIRAKKNCLVNNVFEFNRDDLNAELYDVNYEKIDLELRNSGIENKIESQKVLMHQNYPNPVVQNTVVKIESSVSVSADLLITNIKGEVVGKRNVQLLPGENFIELDCSPFLSERFLLYSLEIDGEIIDTKQMILVGL